MPEVEVLQFGGPFDVGLVLLVMAQTHQGVQEAQVVGCYDVVFEQGLRTDFQLNDFGKGVGGFAVLDGLQLHQQQVVEVLGAEGGIHAQEHRQLAVVQHVVGRQGHPGEIPLMGDAVLAESEQLPVVGMGLRVQAVPVIGIGYALVGGRQPVHFLLLFEVDTAVDELDGGGGHGLPRLQVLLVGWLRAGLLVDVLILSYQFVLECHFEHGISNLESTFAVDFEEVPIFHEFGPEGVLLDGSAEGLLGRYHRYNNKTHISCARSEVIIICIQMMLSTFESQQKEQPLNADASTKTFDYNGAKCSYRNETEVVEQGKNSNIESIKIRNMVCRQKNGKLEKVTEIVYGGTKVVIRDNYEFDRDGQLMDCRQDKLDAQQIRSKKVTLFKKAQTFKGGREGPRRNTKNIVKNIIKWFITYLRSLKKQGSFITDRGNQFIFSAQHFNNDLIQKIVRNPQLGPEFKQFLENHAEHRISESRIVDKDVHQEAVEIYLALFQEGPELSELSLRGKEEEDIGAEVEAVEAVELLDWDQCEERQKNYLDDLLDQ